MKSAGIDYGLGSTNVDTRTGIRYGCISQHSILQAWSDESEPDYGEPDDLTELTAEEFDQIEPCGYTFEGDGYVMVDCLNSDVLVIKSPFYTFGPYCSPCVPGAVSLDSAGDFFEDDKPALDAACLPRAYCPGHDWFDTGVASYPVFGMISGRQCFPDAWYGHNIDWADASARYGDNWYGRFLFAMPVTATVSDYCS